MVRERMKHQFIFSIKINKLFDNEIKLVRLWLNSKGFTRVEREIAWIGVINGKQNLTYRTVRI